jgi:WD40 repeat protein
MLCGPDRKGIKPSGEDGSHVNTAASIGHSTLLTGDDFGLVNVFRYPGPSCEDALSYAGHSEHVKRVAVSADSTRVFSIGGLDRTII